MSRQNAPQVDEPAEGMVYLRVAEMAVKRGVVSHTGRTPGRPGAEPLASFHQQGIACALWIVSSQIQCRCRRNMLLCASSAK
jgi:hypothetical protein